MSWLKDLDRAIDRVDPPVPPAEPDRPEGDDPSAKAAGLPLNDYGNGQRVKLYFGEEIMFVPRVAWFRWNDRVWQQDSDGMAVRRLAHEIASKIVLEAMQVRFSDDELQILDLADEGEAKLSELRAKGSKLDVAAKMEMQRLQAIADRADTIRERMSKKREKFYRHAKAAGNSGPITNMLKECEPYVARTVDALNADPLLLNVQSHTLAFVVDPDFEPEWERDDLVGYKIETRPHDRADLITKMMPVDYDPEAVCPTFDRFLEEIQPDPDMRSFLQRWFGYTLTGLTSEQKLVFLHGVGRNGKSTLVDIIARMLGEYATSVPIETLTGSEQRKGADATPDLVRIPGARMVRASEPEEGLKFKEAMIKLLTGGEPILIRRMREEFVEVAPIFKLTISGNHKPAVRGTDDGIWRRMLLVPFDQQIAKSEVDPLLPQKLWAERSGILNWLLAGACEFLRRGLVEPESVRQATDEFREESDPMRRFLMEACEITGDPLDVVLTKDLVDAFRLFMKDQGLAEWSGQTIQRRLGEKAGTFRHPPESGATFVRKRTAESNGYSGLRLTPEMRARVSMPMQEDWRS